VKFVSTCVSVIVAFGITAPELSVTAHRTTASPWRVAPTPILSLIKTTATVDSLIQFSLTFLPKMLALRCVRPPRPVRASFQYFLSLPNQKFAANPRVQSPVALQMRPPSEAQYPIQMNHCVYSPRSSKYEQALSRVFQKNLCANDPGLPGPHDDILFDL